MAIKKVTQPAIAQFEQLDTVVDNTQQQVRALDSQLKDTQQTIEELVLQQVKHFYDLAQPTYQSPTPTLEINTPGY